HATNQLEILLRVADHKNGANEGAVEILRRIYMNDFTGSDACVKSREQRPAIDNDERPRWIMRTGEQVIQITGVDCLDDNDPENPGARAFNAIYPDGVTRAALTRDIEN